MPLSSLPSAAHNPVTDIKALLNQLKASGLFDAQNNLIPEAFKAFNEKLNSQTDGFVKAENFPSATPEEYDPSRPAAGLREAELKRASLNRSPQTQHNESQGGFPSFLFWDEKSEKIKKSTIPTGPSNPDVVQWRFGPRPKHWIPETFKQNPTQSPQARGGFLKRDSESSEPKTSEPPSKSSNPFIDERRVAAAQHRGASRKRTHIDEKLLRPVKQARRKTLSPSPFSEGALEELVERIERSPSSPPAEALAPSKTKKLLKGKEVLLPRQETRPGSESDSFRNMLRPVDSLSDETGAIQTQPVSIPVVSISDADAFSAPSQSMSSEAIKEFADSLPPKVLRELMKLQGYNLVKAENPVAMVATNFARSTRQKNIVPEAVPVLTTSEKPKKLPSRTKRAEPPQASPEAKAESPVDVQPEIVVKDEPLTNEAGLSASSTIAASSSAENALTFTDLTPKAARELQKLQGNFAEGHFGNNASTTAEEAFSITGRPKRQTKSVLPQITKATSPAPAKKRMGRPKRNS